MEKTLLNLKKAEEAIREIRKEFEMKIAPIETIEEFEKILKNIDTNVSTKSKWRTGSRRPNWDTLKIFHEKGVPLEAWFDIKSYLRDLKKESSRRINVLQK